MTDQLTVCHVILPSRVCDVTVREKNFEPARGRQYYRTCLGGKGPVKLINA